MSIVNRERRKNAGKRMEILGKKMEEEDDAFWGHETWAEDDSGNESFHESDEDSALRKDVFDSDFNDSESDNEDEKVAAGEAEERELRKSERARRRPKTNIHAAYGNLSADVSARGKGRKGGSGAFKRAIGEGFNAGIVLNLPPESSDSLAYMESLSEKANGTLQVIQHKQPAPLEPETQTTSTKVIPSTTTSTDLANLTRFTALPPASEVTVTKTTTAQATTTTSSSQRKSSRRATRDPVVRESHASSRERRSQTRKLRSCGGSATEATRTMSTRKTAPPSGQKKPSSSGVTPRVLSAAKQKRISQEELLLEAVHDTEPENQRWLHGRKRVQDQHDREKDSNAGLRERHRGRKIVQKFHSRRGCLITLTFPQMDSVPEILTRRQQSLQQHQTQDVIQGAQPPSQPLQQQSKRCVITGRIGRYLDPLTKHPYYDVTAFKELRRRHKAGLSIANGCVVESNVSNKRKIPSNSAQNELSSTKMPATGQKSKPIPITVCSCGGNTTNELAKRQQGAKGKSSSSSVNVNQKLPFQSPKLPSKSKTVTMYRQKKNSLNHLVLPLEGNSGSASAAAKNSDKFLVCPSGRRLSPRKRKPSEKVLETMAMLPRKGSGGNEAVTPNNFWIDPKKSQPAKLPKDRRQNSGNKKDNETSNPKSSNSTALASALPKLVLKLLPSVQSMPSTINGSNQMALEEKSVVYRDPNISTAICPEKDVLIPPLAIVVDADPSKAMTTKPTDDSSDGNIVVKSATDKTPSRDIG